MYTYVDADQTAHLQHFDIWVYLRRPNFILCIYFIYLFFYFYFFFFCQKEQLSVSGNECAQVMVNCLKD